MVESSSVRRAKDPEPCDDLEKLMGLVNDCVDRYTAELSNACERQDYMRYFA